MSTFQRVTRLQAVEAVVEQLRSHIIEGRFERGDRLPSELALAEQLGVSRNTVREALRSLEAQGWVQRSKTGTQVLTRDSDLLEQSLISVAQLQQLSVAELFEVRRSLECEQAALAAQRATAEERQEILRLVTAMESPGLTDEAFVAQNLCFHAAIAKASHNRLFEVLFAALRALVAMVQQAGALRPEMKGVALAEHRRIAEAIMAGDVTRVREAMSRHLDHVESGLDMGFSFTQ